MQIANQGQSSKFFFSYLDRFFKSAETDKEIRIFLGKKTDNSHKHKKHIHRVGINLYLFFANILWGHHSFYRRSWGIVHIWAIFIMFDYELYFVFTKTITRQRIIPPALRVFWPMCFSFFFDWLLSNSKNVNFLQLLWHSWNKSTFCLLKSCAY